MDSYDHLKRQYDELVESQKARDQILTPAAKKRKTRSQAAKDATIRTFARRARLVRDAESYERALRQIVDVYDARSELFTSDAECAASLADRARIVLSSSEDPAT
jgi:hypothetical protein